MNKPIFIFISKKIKTKDIYNYLYHNNWIEKNSDINIHILSKEELKDYNINTKKEALGIYKEDISIEFIVNNTYKKVFYDDEEDITIYSLISRRTNNYEYIPYITNKLGLKYNFYNIEKEYHKLAYKESFIYHDKKSYEGYLLNVIEINNNDILKSLLGNKKIKDNYKLELIEDIYNLEDAISYIFSINKYKNNNYELIESNESLSNKIDIFTKKIESIHGKLVSLYEMNSNLADNISSFAINISMWCLIFNKHIIIIDYGTYE
ncbi:MAG: hypothetical protein IKF19_06630 [Bacilli bacterium]|nr:hypothetical protein [Bacilli bacterium]